MIFYVFISSKSTLWKQALCRMQLCSLNKFMSVADECLNDIKVEKCLQTEMVPDAQNKIRFRSEEHTVTHLFSGLKWIELLSSSDCLPPWNIFTSESRNSSHLIIINGAQWNHFRLIFHCLRMTCLLQFWKPTNKRKQWGLHVSWFQISAAWNILLLCFQSVYSLHQCSR